MNNQNEPYETNPARVVAKAKSLLAETDYAMLTDVVITNKTEFAQYREFLREAVKAPKNPTTFPNMPEPEWAEE